MNRAVILSMLEGLDDFTKERIVTNLKSDLMNVIKDLNEYLIAYYEKIGKPTSCDILSPAPKLIFESMRRCSLKDAKVVIIAQDPFINVGQATGLCFSVPSSVKKLPPSTIKINECLTHYGMLPADGPQTGDYSHWADQGVLMLNASLTTILGKSNEHETIWRTYTDKVVEQLSNLPQRLIFILLGGFAQKKAEKIDQRHIKLTWGHPSPMNSANRTDNPTNFKYCDAFMKTNQILVTGGEKPILWGTIDVPVEKLVELPLPVPTPTITKAPRTRRQQTQPLSADGTIEVTFTPAPEYTYEHSSEYAGMYTHAPSTQNDPVPTTKDTLWVFTDGGATANGKPECEASWAFFCTNGITTARASGRVEPKFLPGCRFKASNNRGELTAILHAMEYLLGLYLSPPELSYREIIIVSDSDLSIAGIDDRDLIGKKNVDLLGPAKTYIAKLRMKTPVRFKHVRASHDVDAPVDPAEKFLWQGNTIVDSMCNRELGLDDKKKRITKK